MMSDKKHSPIGASSCERWFNCPGSVQLLATLPPGESSQYAAQGTVAHSVSERVLLDMIFKRIPSMVSLAELEGTTEVQDGYEIEIDETMTDAAQIYIDLLMGEYLKNLTPKLDLRLEQAVFLRHIDPEAYGTCDAIIVVPMHKLVVIDFKYGQGYAVEVENNYQLMYYALGAYYGLSESDRFDLDSVEMVIVQPRAKHLDGPIRRHTISLETLFSFELELREAIARVRSGHQQLRMGKWCKFCGAKAICSEYAAGLERETELKFTAYDVEPAVLPAPQQFSPERLSQLMQNAEVIRDWVKSVIDITTLTAIAGTPIPGYKLVTKVGNRRWINEKDVQDSFELEFGDDIYTKKLKSPAQLEKIAKARKAEIETLTERPETGRTLVRDDDERPEKPTFEPYVEV